MKEYEEFSRLLESENKQEAVRYALGLVESGAMDVKTLYTQVLTPSLNLMQCRMDDKRMCVWKEHVRTAIVRTIVECCYPFVLKELDAAGITQNKTAVVICPPEEYHDLGARMVADFFTLCGWKAIFIGGNTPYEDFFNAASIIRPDIIAISITNFYTIVAAKKIIAELKALLGDSVKIVVGGFAVRESPDKFKTLGADLQIDTFDDIKEIAFKEGEKI